MSDVVALKQEEVDEINQELYGGRVEELFVKQGLSDSICDSLPTLENRNGDTARRAKVVAGLYQGKYFLHDSRFVLLENTVSSFRLDLRLEICSIADVYSYIDLSLHLESWISPCRTAGAHKQS